MTVNRSNIEKTPNNECPLESVNKKHDTSATGWARAVVLCELSGERGEKADALLSRYSKGISTRDRQTCQRLFFGAVRHRRLLEAAIGQWVKRPPRSRLKAILMVSAFDLLSSDPERAPAVVSYAVDQAKSMVSAHEVKLVNAVLRKLPSTLRALQESAPLDIRYSHPKWLVDRWLHSWGEEATGKLLEWNQAIPDVFVRWRGRGEVPLELLEPTDWQGVYRLRNETVWEELLPYLAEGKVYIQDPGTRLAPGLLAVKPGETVLDLCAAPGGKTMLLVDALGDDASGLLVAVDKPGKRLEQLDENLRKLDTGTGPEVRLLGEDILTLAAESVGQFDAVLLDAPCSNTGVIRRRPDAKWRLQPESIMASAELQLKLLRNAARLVKKGGRLVYSTCSVEPEENEGVVRRFLEENPEFTLVEGRVYFPWECGHDGAGAFLLRYDP